MPHEQCPECKSTPPFPHIFYCSHYPPKVKVSDEEQARLDYKRAEAAVDKYWNEAKWFFEGKWVGANEILTSLQRASQIGMAYIGVKAERERLRAYDQPPPS